MFENEYYISKALKHLKNSKDENTIQILTDLSLEFSNDKPNVSRIKFDENIISVYFKVLNKKVFVVENLINTEFTEHQSTWIESGHKVYFTATSQSKTYNELLSYTILDGFTGWSIGSRPNFINKTFDCTRVSLEINSNLAYDLNEKLCELLSFLEKDSFGILNLTKNSKAIISIVKYQSVYGNAGIHFDIETINRLQKLNLSIDIDSSII